MFEPNWEEQFIGLYVIGNDDYASGPIIPLEVLYQVFKQRLITEVVAEKVIAPSAGGLGRK